MAQPILKRFYSDRFLHLRSFALSFIVALMACILLWSFRGQEFYHFHFQAAHLFLLPLAIYSAGISAVWIHNATHGSFKNSTINWLCGQIAGIHQLWGFTGWKLIHLTHHMYSDQVEHDPHPPKDLTFWQFARVMFRHSSQKISEKYRHHYGDTHYTRTLQRAGMVMLFAMAGAHLALWFLLLGPAGFIFYYIPSYIANHLLFVDINFSAHPRDAQGNTEAANLNHTLYYKLANFFWHGIYFHGNHHRKPLLFNPRYMPIKKHPKGCESQPLSKAA